jgi:hypothetical protein
VGEAGREVPQPDEWDPGSSLRTPRQAATEARLGESPRSVRAASAGPQRRMRL